MEESSIQRTADGKQDAARRRRPSEACAQRRRATLAGGELRPDLRPVPALSCGTEMRTEMLPQGGASSPPRSTAAPETRRGAASGGDDDSSSGAGSWEERPGLLQARADGARRGALSGGGVRHMLMQISPLGDL